MEKKSWISYNVRIDGGGLVAFVPNPTHYSAQMDAIEYQGLDIPSMGPDTDEPDYTVITELLSTIVPVPLRGPHGDLVVEHTKDLIGESMMSLLSQTDSELESNTHRYELTMPEIGPGEISIAVTPVLNEWHDDKGWVKTVRA